MRKGYRQQARGLVDTMKQETRRTDLEIADSVKHYYYASVLARQLARVGGDTLASMEADAEPDRDHVRRRRGQGEDRLP
jgi:hypothetical protein